MIQIVEYNGFSIVMVKPGNGQRWSFDVTAQVEAVGKTVVVASNTSSIPASILTEDLPEHQKTRVSVNHMYSPHGAASEVGVLDGSSPESDSQPSAQELEKLALVERTARVVEEFNRRLGIELFCLSNQKQEVNELLHGELKLEKRYSKLADQATPESSDVINFLNLSTEIRLAVYIVASVIATA